MPADFYLDCHGTIFLLRPMTEEAVAWITEHIDPQAPYLGRAVAIEHRFVEPIVEGIKSEGLTID